MDCKKDGSLKAYARSCGRRWRLCRRRHTQKHIIEQWTWKASRRQIRKRRAIHLIQMLMHPSEKIAVMMKIVVRRSALSRRTWFAWWRNLRTCKRKRREASYGARSVRWKVTQRDAVQRTGSTRFARSSDIPQKNAPSIWKQQNLSKCFSRKRLLH